MAQYIKGLSEDLTRDYSESYNDTGLKYKFLVSAIFHSKRITRHFTYCSEAADSVDFVPHKPNNESNWYTIFLTRVDGTTVILEDSDIEALISFENSPEIFKFFHRIVKNDVDLCEGLHNIGSSSDSEHI